jgi:hypothetical protein
MPLAAAGGTDAWTVSVPVPHGRHEYAFIVDGKRWVPDPFAPTTSDEFDTTSSGHHGRHLDAAMRHRRDGRESCPEASPSPLPLSRSASYRAWTCRVRACGTQTPFTRAAARSAPRSASIGRTPRSAPTPTFLVSDMGASARRACSRRRFSRRASALTGEFGGSLGGSTHQDGTRTGQMLGLARLHVMRTGRGRVARRRRGPHGMGPCGAACDKAKLESGSTTALQPHWPRSRRSSLETPFGTPTFRRRCDIPQRVRARRQRGSGASPSAPRSVERRARGAA